MGQSLNAEMWGGLTSKKPATKGMWGLKLRKQNFLNLNIEFMNSEAISKEVNV